MFKNKTALLEAKEFIDNLSENTEYIPNEKRIAKKDKFIKAVKDFSEFYEINADLSEKDGCVKADIYIDESTYFWYGKKLFDSVFLICDEFSVFLPELNSGDNRVLFSFIYYTHDVYINGKKTTELN